MLGRCVRTMRCFSGFQRAFILGVLPLFKCSLFRDVAGMTGGLFGGRRWPWCSESLSHLSQRRAHGLGGARHVFVPVRPGERWSCPVNSPAPLLFVSLFHSGGPPWNLTDVCLPPRSTVGLWRPDWLSVPLWPAPRPAGAPQHLPQGARPPPVLAGLGLP